jgi:cullin 1
MLLHQVNLGVLASVVRSTVEWGVYMDRPDAVYQAAFESRYLSHMADYYAHSSVSTDTPRDYFPYAYKRYLKEMSLAADILPTHTHTSTGSSTEGDSPVMRVSHCLLSVLITTHRTALDASLSEIFRLCEADILHSVCGLYERLPGGIDVLAGVLRQTVMDEGRALAEQLGGDALRKPKKYARVLLQLYDRYYALVEAVFTRESNDSSPPLPSSGRGEADDGRVLHAFYEGVRYVLNSPSLYTGATRNIAPEMLAKYTDMLLRRGKVKLSEDEIDTRLDRVMVLFRLCNNKDVFQAYYERMLARRLLHAVSVSLDAEHAMVARLTAAVGHNYTHKFSQMFTDMALSEDMTKEFNASSGGGGGGGDVWMGVRVLKTSAWRGYSADAKMRVPLVLSGPLAQCVSAFETFYEGKHSGRKLTWLHALSKGELRTGYLHGGEKDLLCSAVQLSLLLLFNTTDTLTFASVASSLALSSPPHVDMLRRQTAHIVKEGILLIDSGGDAGGGGGGDVGGGEIGDETVLRVNAAYENKRRRVKITSSVSMSSSSVSGEERAATEAAIADGRRFVVQAAIVRVMKARKKLPHTQLVAQVIQQTRASHVPNVAAIKTEVEALIEREYLCRADDGYEYLA